MKKKCEKIEQKSILEEALPPLLLWYEKNKRSLPWRDDPTPYHVWVSEIMLQQTRVEAVKGYYGRFMKELPTIRDLANAKEDVCNKLWEGLGYYSRVRNLSKAAMQVEEKYAGNLPSEEQDLLTLPGIGNYTAAAIASIAYGRNAAAVDGNVLRVVTRLLAEKSDIGDAAFRKEVKKKLEEVYELMDLIKNGEQSVAGDINQAFMDLGSGICLPNGEPKCSSCPMQSYCQAHIQGKEKEFPHKAPKKERVVEKKTVLLIKLGERVLLHKRPERGLLAGLYEFPCLEGYVTAKEVLSYVESLGLHAIRIQKLSSAKHIFTHKEWHMKGYEVCGDEIQGEEKLTKEDFYRFVSLEEIKTKYAIPSAYKNYTNLL